MLAEQLIRVRSRERRLAGQQLEERAAEAVNVGPRVEILIANLLGRHVAPRTLHGLFAKREHRREAALLTGRNREVDQLDDTLVADKEIIRLHIAMDPAFVVEIEQRL